MITGELVLINSEFQVDIQDLNFLPMSMANIESTTTTSGPTSSYSWSTPTSLGRLFTQTMANTNTYENSTPNSQLINTDNKDNDEVSNEVNDEFDDENTTNSLSNAQTHVHRRKRSKN